MKLIFKEFYCPECKQIRWLKTENICVGCKDKRILNEVAQTRKLYNPNYHEISV